VVRFLQVRTMETILGKLLLAISQHQWQEPTHLEVYLSVNLPCISPPPMERPMPQHSLPSSTPLLIKTCSTFILPMWQLLKVQLHWEQAKAITLKYITLILEGQEP